MWKASGKKPQQLAEQPEMPADLGYLWAWFCELRPESSYAELSAWAAMTGRSLARWELETLVSLDRMRCARD